jgi:hypothetical protein
MLRKAPKKRGFYKERFRLEDPSLAVPKVTKWCMNRRRELTGQASSISNSTGGSHDIDVPSGANQAADKSPAASSSRPAACADDHVNVEQEHFQQLPKVKDQDDVVVVCNNTAGNMNTRIPCIYSGCKHVEVDDGSRTNSRMPLPLALGCDADTVEVSTNPRTELGSFYSETGLGLGLSDINRDGMDGDRDNNSDFTDDDALHLCFDEVSCDPNDNFDSDTLAR